MTVLDPLAIRSRGRGANFGTLTAGMVLRGSVPAQVLYGANAPVRPTLLPPPASAPVAPAPAAAVETAEAVSPAMPPLPGLNGATGRRAMTVRLDAARHMRLRLVSSYLKQSSQAIIVAALDAYFARLPAEEPGSHCACLGAPRPTTGPR